ncbi:DEKNAAC101929 [Brettanomyces naardenensis]|uniref:DEKNAAC101929 n=1 Tax=Brettanomyces naardenensis TaxID=13370 RepID=A0A448YJN2_BRENA|nr:DEKNAAC101929 [Brettanomyces naardenensis]
MSQIISAINEFNSRFPLVKYQSISSESDSFNQLITKRQFDLRQSSEDDEKNKFSKFKLGIYNVTPFSFDENILVTLDPLCLSTMLILAAKTHHSLHHLRSSRTDASTSSGVVLVLSYSASPDGELPILIEDEVNRTTRKVKRKTRSTSVINNFELGNVKDPKELMYIKLVDTILFDFFIAALAASHDQKLIMRLYSLAGIEEKERGIFDKLMYPAVMAHLVKRFQFDVRNPTIALEYNGNTLISWIRPKYYTQALAEEFERCQNEGIETLLQFERLYAQSGNSFLSSNTKPCIFDYKLAAMVYCICDLEEVVEDFSGIKQKCPSLFNHCEMVMRTVMK